MLEAVGSFLAKLYPPWIIADVVMGVVSLLYVAVTGGLAGLLGEVAINAAIGAIPFPLNFLVVFYVSPIYLVLQIVLFIILLFAFERR